MSRFRAGLCGAFLLASSLARHAESGAQRDDVWASIRALLDAGRYEEADARAEPLNPGTTLVARQLQIEARLRNGRGGDPQTLLLAKALVADPQTMGATREAEGNSRRLLGDALFEGGSYSQALGQYRTATLLHDAGGKLQGLDVARDLECTSRALLLLDQFAAADVAIDRAVAIARTAGDGPELSRMLATRGLIRQRRGRYGESRKDLGEAMALQSSSGSEHPDAIRLLTLSGNQLWFDSDFAGARRGLDEAVAIADRLLRRDHPAKAESLRLQAMILEDLGEVEAGRNARLRAVAIAADAYGKDHPQYALQLHDLALSYMKRGDYGEARARLRQALSIYERRLGRSHSEVGSTLHNLGILAASLGDYREAAVLQRRAVLAWEQSVGRNHPMVPWALVALAEALSSQGRDEEAVPVLQRALVIRERVLEPGHVQIGTTLNAMSRSLLALGRLRQAAATVERGIAIWRSVNNDEGLSDALVVRARIASGRGDYAAAHQDYDRALALRLPIYGATHPSVGSAQVALAVTSAGLSRSAEAFQLALDGERVSRDHIRLTTGFLPEQQALGYAASRTRGLDVALSLIEAGDPALAFDAVIRGRSVILDEMAARQRLRADAASAELEPLWLASTTASRRLANLAVRGPGDESPNVYAARLDRARRDKAAAEIALADHSVTIRQRLAKRDVGLDALRADVPADGAVVAFVRYDRLSFVVRASGRSVRTVTPSYAAFVLGSRQSDPTFIRLASAAVVDTAIERWRATATSGMAADGSVRDGAERALRAKGSRVRELIWDPLRPALAHTTRVFIVPDGTVNLVPFAALPTGGASYLADAGVTLHYLSAERDLVESDVPPRTKGMGLLAVGGPAYGTAGASPPPRLGTARSGDSGSGGGRRSGCGTFDAMRFQALPASRREAEDVGMLWRTLAAGATPDAHAEVLTGTKASEAALKRTRRRQRVLHIATHGFFLGGDCETDDTWGRGVGLKTGARPARPTSRATLESPLLLSGLALAGANQRASAGPNDEDGILTAEEVAALDLDGVEWAVLSACDSGLGEIRGGEGVFGLRRAFRTGGARTVIMSLWPVEDRAARAWMRALYTARLRDQLTTADAMRQASLTVLAERRAKHLSTHPLYWGGFVAAGDWR